MQKELVSFTSSLKSISVYDSLLVAQDAILTTSHLLPIYIFIRTPLISPFRLPL